MSASTLSSTSLQYRGLLTASPHWSKPQWIDDFIQLLRPFALTTAGFSPTPAPMPRICSCPHNGNVTQKSSTPFIPHPTIRKPKQHSGACAVSPWLPNKPLLGPLPPPHPHCPVCVEKHLCCHVGSNGHP